MNHPFPSPVEKRVQEILQVVLAYAMGDFSDELPITGDDSVFDEIAAGINVLGEELQSKIQSIEAYQHHLQKIQSSMGEALLVLSPSLTIVSANPRALELTGYEMEALLGQHVKMLFEEHTYERLQVTQRVGLEQPERLETECLTSSQALVPVSLSISVMQGEGGKVLGVVCIAQDITERKRVEKELRLARQVAEEASAAKSSFLASTSHELRTPLNAIIGYSQLVIEELREIYQGAEALVPDIKKIEVAGQYLLVLINNILDLSKVEADKMEALIEPFEVHHLLHTIKELAEPLAAKNDNELILEAPESLGEMKSDVTKLQQILFNLISNACKFTFRGQVRLSGETFERDGCKWFGFTISDTGIGMTEEHQARLFQPFSQAHAGISKEYGGTGLGLVLCRRFCELLGGHITVSSTPDKGSTFLVQLPTDPA